MNLARNGDLVRVARARKRGVARLGILVIGQKPCSYITRSHDSLDSKQVHYRRRPHIQTSKMATVELATTYAALILADDGIEITSDKITTLTNAAGVDVESIWAMLLAKALEGKDIKELLLNVGAGGGTPVGAVSAPVGGSGATEPAEAPKEEEKKEEKEESDEDMGFGLFD